MFFDRDGVVNVSPGNGYVTGWEDFHFSDGLSDVIRLVKERGYITVLVTSQRCVGLKEISIGGLEEIHGQMQSQLREHGLEFLDIYAFLGTPETAAWEKPSPEMILLAAQKHDIDLAASWMIGDADRDIQMARSAGVGKTLRVVTDKSVGVPADFTVADLLEARVLLDRELPA